MCGKQEEMKELSEDAKELWKYMADMDLEHHRLRGDPKGEHENCLRFDFDSIDATGVPETTVLMGNE